ncbi:MAG TPA: hypothetical protein V6D07_06425 [Trichocoleus sp.]
MDGEQAETVLDKRISLPEPDIENITVLTKSLPNEPILPWHHFDSPWLEREEATTEEAESEVQEPEAETEDSEQLTLELELELPPIEQVPDSIEAPSIAPPTDISKAEAESD